MTANILTPLPARRGIALFASLFCSVFFAVQIQAQEPVLGGSALFPVNIQLDDYSGEHRSQPASELRSDSMDPNNPIYVFTETDAYSVASGVMTLAAKPESATRLTFPASLGQDFTVSFEFASKATQSDLSSRLIFFWDQDSSAGVGALPLDEGGAVIAAVYRLSIDPLESQALRIIDESETELIGASPVLLPNVTYRVTLQLTSSSVNVWLDGTQILSLAHDFSGLGTGAWGLAASSLAAGGVDLQNVLAENPSTIVDPRSDTSLYTADLWEPVARFDPGSDYLVYFNDNNYLSDIYGELSVCAKVVRDRDAFNELLNIRSSLISGVPGVPDDPNAPYDVSLRFLEEELWTPQRQVLSSGVPSALRDGLCQNVYGNTPSGIGDFANPDMPHMYFGTGPDLLSAPGQRLWMNDEATALANSFGPELAVLTANTQLQGFDGTVLTAEERQDFFLSTSGNCLPSLVACTADTPTDPNQPLFIGVEGFVSDVARRQRLGWVLDTYAETFFANLVKPGTYIVKLIAALRQTLQPLADSLEVGGSASGESADEEMRRLIRARRLLTALIASDTDGDGVPNDSDAFPSIALGGLADTDNDGAPDDCDAVCVLAGMVADDDDDNDGVLDPNDTYALIPLDGLTDTDGDGAPDDCDADCLLTGMAADTDDDNDGVLDVADVFSLIPIGGLTDTDGDGAPDDCDADCLMTGMAADDDDDNDGVSDLEDAYALIPLNGLTDTDNDGAPDDCDADCLLTGMAADDDDDGDDVLDASDAFPLISLDGRVDTDADGVPNDCDSACLLSGMSADPDDDADGVLDENDAFPLDATESVDSDGDGVGDNREAIAGTDPNLADSDGDGFSDLEELDIGSDPLSADDFPLANGLDIILIKAALDTAR